ncbi:MAG TPA: hypothetical protein VGD37_31245 [Kofleriaceae bacterium]|jgi:hypothetical protein
MRPALALAALALALLTPRATAHAYPQLQLSRDATCSGCHISPAGGGLLTENGLNTAESMSRWGTAPEFFYGKIPTPSWLTLGGDLRGATGYVQTPEKLLASFPMQIEAYGQAVLGAGISLYVDVGSRASEVGKETTTFAWSREHYLMWQERPGETAGLSVRAGRFMPVFGLRLAEHPTYIRRWGGTPLYGETYGVAAEYVDPRFEAHVTGFLKDPLLDTPEHSNGGAAIGEVRITPRLSVGAEAMYTQSTDDKKVRVGALGRLYLEGPELLLQAEGQFMNQLIQPRGAPKQIIAYLLASRFIGQAYLLDVGLGFFDENIQITELHREAVDLNFHWFATSHVEAIFTGRFETLAFGAGGPSGGYALAQLHYRL